MMDDYDKMVMRELASAVCQAFSKSTAEGPMPCGGAKVPGRTFCLGCYRRLPALLAKNLYHRVGRGYAEAYDEAQAYFRRLDLDKRAAR